MESIYKNTSSFWWLIGGQALLCLFMCSIFEVLGGSDQVIISLLLVVVLIGIAAFCKGFKLPKPMADRVLFMMLACGVTLFNIMVFGFLLGQLVAMWFGVWSFPAPD